MGIPNTKVRDLPGIVKLRVGRVLGRALCRAIARTQHGGAFESGLRLGGVGEWIEATRREGDPDPEPDLPIAA